MRRLMTSFRTQRSERPNLLHLGVRRASNVLAVAGVLSFSNAFAKEPDPTESKTTVKATALKPEARAESEAIPHCLEKLKLSSKQQDEIKAIVSSYDVSIDTVWKQFSDRYMQAITMESTLLAAIEDNLTEQQRAHVRDQRHKTAQHEKIVAGTSEKPNQAKTKPASAVEDEIAGVGITLTSDQEAAADKVQEKYRSPLRSLNRDIQGLHTRLLSLEADKHVAFEKVLTKEQLAEWRSNRQNAPEVPKVANKNTEATKTE